MIRLSGIGKAFQGTKVLDNVAMDIAPGRIHGLLGENGAGKTTLMRILYGLVAPDAGEIMVDGRLCPLLSPPRAQRLGIGMVHQHFSLIGSLTAVDNLILAAGGGLGPPRRAAWGDRLRRLSADLGWTIDGRSRVDALAVGIQQRLEIVKALCSGGRTLILDEPTAVLTPQETSELLSALRGLAARGTAIVLISHKLDEIRSVCDEVSILRHGSLVHHGPVDVLSREEMTRLIIGNAPPELPQRSRAAPLSPTGAAPAPVLIVRDLSLGTATGKPELDHVSLTVSAGEIVGIAGVDGNGQQPLIDAILGLRRASSGSVEMPALSGHGSAPRLGSPALGVVPGDRRREGLVLSLPIMANLLLKAGRRPPCCRAGWLRLRAWRAQARVLAQAGGLRPASLDLPVSTLSGGNQQKVVLARELGEHPSVIVAVNPTRGLDVGAAAAVMAAFIAAASRGAGVLLMHNDLDEMLQVVDRVLVLHDGRLRDAEWPRRGREHIGELMLGSTEPVAPHAAASPLRLAGHDS